MKKIITALTLICLCVALLASCGAAHPIDKLEKSIMDEKNVQVDITMSDIPFFGTVQVTMKIDGNKTYTSGLFGESATYTETDGDTVYTYTQNDDEKWTKTSSTVTPSESDNIISDNDMSIIFDSENYTQSKDNEKKYIMNDDVTFEGFSEITLTIIEDGCIVEGKLNSDGMVCGIKMTFHKIGETSITLPEVK